MRSFRLFATTAGELLMNDGGFDQRRKQRVHGALAALTSCSRVSIMPNVQLTFLFLQYVIAQHKTNADGAFSSQSSRITLDLHCPLPVLQPFHQPRVLFHQLVEACAAGQRQQRVWVGRGVALTSAHVLVAAQLRFRAMQRGLGLF